MINPQPSGGTHSTKVLSCTVEATRYQRDYVADLKRRVIDNGEPFAIVQADTPHEIFHAMDIPIVTNQWWSSYIAAKQLSPRYVQVLEREGYTGSTCKYCSLGLACTLDNDPKTAPWGGLPRPTVLVARLTCDCIQRVFRLWAEKLGSHFYPLEAPGWEHKDIRWFENNKTDWESVYTSPRLDLMVEEMRGLIALLEEKTGRKFDEQKLRVLMEDINRQEELMGEASNLVTRTRPCPVGIADQMPNVMIPQWHRGAPWAVDHARKFRDEVKQRVAEGAATVSSERIRLMWIGAGLWHDPGFYNALEERHRAVFVWSMYLPFAYAKYPRYGLQDPLRALASRICGMNEVLHLPPWMNEWMASEAKACGIDACVILQPETNRLSVSGTKITRNALEAAGVPVFEIAADMVDGSKWRHEDMVGQVSRFLTERVEAQRWDRTMKQVGGALGGILLVTGAIGLMGAMLSDTVAVAGRHLGTPLLGSIELVQAFIVLGAASAIAYAPLGATHAAVDLVFRRLPVSAQRIAHGLAALLGFVFLAALVIGSAWIAWEYRDAGERTELLGIELKWLRLFWLACAVISAAAMLAPFFGKKSPQDASGSH